MLYNQNKSCVKSCQKHCFLKNPLFSKKPIVFQHVHFFIPLFWNEKLSLMVLLAFGSHGYFFTRLAQKTEMLQCFNDRSMSYQMFIKWPIPVQWKTFNTFLWFWFSHRTPRPIIVQDGLNTDQLSSVCVRIYGYPIVVWSKTPILCMS